MGKAPQGSSDSGETSFHLRRAQEGDEEGVAQVVARFTPFLRLQAQHRLRGARGRACEPEDLIDEVWAVTLPRLADLEPRDGCLTPVLLKFLSRTLLYSANRLLTRHLRDCPAGWTSSESDNGLDRFPAAVTSVLRGVTRSEVAEQIQAALQELGPAERQIVVLRGIEQLSNQEICRALDLKPSAVSMRYRRALAALRARLPGSLFDELPDS